VKITQARISDLLRGWSSHSSLDVLMDMVAALGVTNTSRLTVSLAQAADQVHRSATVLS